METAYPRFIQSKPCGIDKSEGKAQELLKDAIANHIITTDKGNDNSNQLPRIIGLEGGWGVGKSNVIRQLRDKLEGKYYLFEYDAWGHQEDLQRRSFLELLTEELITKAEILTGSTTIKIKGGGKESVSWQDKLKYLLARKTETRTEKYPQLSKSIIASFLVAVFTPVCIYCGVILKIDNFWSSLLIALLPVLITLAIWGIAACKHAKYRNVSYLFAIFNDKIENDICYETISEDEPTVTEFKAWMQDISDHIKDNDKPKLIVVFDNMDRLPAEKVKELWSSIHTFFSEDGFENIWAIIPFDEAHLSCAFGEAADVEQKHEIEKLTRYFISKTFPIVYRVTPPVITDSKNLFNALYGEAFGETESENQEKVSRIFRLEKPNATVRDMIIFINHLVALKTIWKAQIDVLSMAIFTLKKDALLHNTVHQILSGEYLVGNIISIVPNNEALQKNISALAYGVLPDDAAQIPISNYIEGCLKSEKGYDINLYATHRHFLSVLTDKVKDSGIPIDTLIKELARLNPEFEKQYENDIIGLWNHLAEQKVRIPLAKQEFDDAFQTLLSHISQQYKEKVVKYLCEGLQSFKEFDGAKYYTAISGLDNHLKDNQLEISVELSEIEKNSSIFIDYMTVAKENYSNYKLNVNPDALDLYLANTLFDSAHEDEVWWRQDPKDNSKRYVFPHDTVIDILKILKADKFGKFDKLLSKIEAIIKANAVKASAFKKIFDVYKILSEEKPLPTQLNATQRESFWNHLHPQPNKPEHLEIVVIQIANGTHVQGTYDESQIKTMAENMDYYAHYGETLINNLSWNIPVLSQVLKYMTENKIGNLLSLATVLPRFFEIKQNIGVTEAVLLWQFNRCKVSSTSITQENIATIIPKAQFFQYSLMTKNALTDYLNETVIDALTTHSADLLHQQRQNPNDYWITVIKHFIDTDYLKTLPDNLTEFGKRLLDDIAAGRQAVPSQTDLLQKIIAKMDRRKTAAHIKVIRDKFCNSQYTMTIQIFNYFESWFEQQGDLLSRSTDVVPKIIEPVIDDTICLGIIVSKSDYYAQIINNAGDDATGLKKKIEEKLRTSEDEKVIEFAKKIEISQQKG